eukprot:5392886-Amphidinium_carterae.1
MDFKVQCKHDPKDTEKMVLGIGVLTFVGINWLGAYCAFNLYGMCLTVGFARCMCKNCETPNPPVPQSPQIIKKRGGFGVSQRKDLAVAVRPLPVASPVCACESSAAAWHCDTHSNAPSEGQPPTLQLEPLPLTLKNAEPPKSEK